MAGDTFSEYDGPMKGALHRWCFVCGADSRYGIRVKGKLQIIGACKEHLAFLKQYRPPAQSEEIPTEVASSKVSTPELHEPTTQKKTLGELLADPDYCG